jgi:hypothetical protein
MLSETGAATLVFIVVIESDIETEDRPITMWQQFTLSR